MKPWIPVILVYCLIVAIPALVYAQDEDEEGPPPAPAPEGVITPDSPEPKPKVNNLPSNMYGLSGLLLTTSTRTLKPGQFEAGIGGSMEESSTPEYYRREVVFLGTVGIPAGFEFGLRVPYVMTNLLIEPRFNDLGVLVRGYGTDEYASVGSIEGMFKWGFVQQQNFLPAFALGLGAIAPGGDYNRRASEVKYYGLKLMLAMGLEINDLPFTDYAFAIMADGVLVGRDMGIDNQEYEEKHGLVHAGMIFPLLPRNFLELIVEYEGVLMRGTTNEEDTNAVLGSLRFVTNHFNVTAGAQYTFKEDEDFDDTLRYLANFSYTYF